MSYNNRKIKTYLSFAEIDITPKESIDLVGFNRGDNRSRGVLHQLLAQTVLLKHGKNLFCIISIDNIGLTVMNSNHIRNNISEILCTKIENIMLCFSHTHSAPNTDDGTVESKEYYHFLKEQICCCVKKANEKFTECKGVWGMTKTEVGANRRNPQGVTDNRIGVLKFTDAKTNKPVLILLRVTAHGNVLVRDNFMISSDYFGVTREKLEKRYGCKVMMTQGASGNIKPIFQNTVNDLYKMSDAIEASLEDYIDSMIPQEIEKVTMFSLSHTFDTTEIPSRDVAETIALKAKSECNIDGKEWLRRVQELSNSGITKQSMEMEIQFFKLNNGGLCGIPLEPFCEIALNSAEAVKNELMFFGGYTNGCDGYFPTSEEYFKGGYEVFYSYLIYSIYYGRVMPLKLETANEIVHIIEQGWNSDFIKRA